MPIADYESFEHPPLGGSQRTVYFRHPEGGPGPPIILMHELPGMTKECIDRANDLLGEGFTVYLPLLFGEAGKRLSVPAMFRICLRKEFGAFAAGQTSPIAGWLRSLCRHISVDLHGGAGAGVIGMCLTGNFVLYMIADGHVLAPVLCQPSLPLKWPFRRQSEAEKADLKVSKEDLVEIKKTVEVMDLPIRGLRFSDDKLCQKERFLRLADEFPDHFVSTTIPSREKKAHATLTKEYAKHPGTREAFREIIDFMKARLGQPSPV